MNQRILDLWEQELKLGAKLEELGLVKKELLELTGGSSIYTTSIRTVLQRREQSLLLDLRSKVSHRERLEAEEEVEDDE